MKKYRTKDFSFVPDNEWLNRYRERYTKWRQKIKDAGLDDEAEKEEDTTNSAAWLAIADWDIYIQKVMNGLKNHTTKYGEDFSGILGLFKLFAEELSIPWNTDYFNELVKRKLIGGINP